jgi:peptide/nickel transport system permease protein
MRLIAWVTCLAAAALAVGAVTRAGRAGGAGASPWRRALARLASDRGAMLALFVLVALAAIALLAPWLTRWDPSAQPDIILQKNLPPSIDHLFGTDFASRDVLSRVLSGARISLSVASLAVIVSMVVGTTYGAVAGFYGGRLDGAMMRVLDAAMSVPRILMLIAAIAIAGRISLPVLIVLLGLTGWFGTSRLVRAQVLALREQDLTLAARALGARDREILARHILPNILSTVIIAATLSLGNVILLEAALGYLGIGVRPPTPSWGNIIQEGSEQIANLWWMSVFPGIAIVTTVLAVNAFGDSLRDALDPRKVDRP